MAQKNGFYRIIIPLVLILVMGVTLAVIDGTRGVYNNGHATKMVVLVCDLSGRPVPEAVVTVVETGQKAVTDLMGKTQPIAIKRTEPKKYDWFCVTVTIQAENFVDTVLFGCVVYDNFTRTVSVRIYPLDGSPLPFVAYSEIPPEEYILSLFD